MATARALGSFLRAIHQPAPADAPHNPSRGVPLADRTAGLLAHLEQVNGLVERAVVLELWERILAAPAWSGRPVWIHGDLHPGNLLVTAGHVSAVIDFGDLAAGDPATDLSVAWMLLPASVRPALRASARGPSDQIDDDTWMRARGWALALGLAYLTQSRDDDAMAALGRSTIDAALGNER